MQLQAGIANHPVRFGVGLDARDSGTCHTQIMRESEERKSLVRRDPMQSPAVLRRTTPYVINGRTAYYTSGRGVSVVTSPGLLPEWYGRVNDWGEKLLNFIERMEGGPFAPRERPDNMDEAIVETTKRAILALRLTVKVGHVLLLGFWAIGYLVYERIKQLGGSH